MRAIDIMSLARERLGDAKKQRWSDSRLLTIVSQGQIDICLEAGYLRKQSTLSLALDKTMYKLPSDCYTIKRLETYDGTLVPLHSRSDKDIPRGITSSFVAYKSNLNVDKLEIVPAPIELVTSIQVIKGFTDVAEYQVTPLYGVVTMSSSDKVEIAPLYGAITGMNSDINANAELSEGYGEVQGLATDASEMSLPNGNYGVLVNVTLTPNTTKYGCITSIKGHKTNGSYGIITNIQNIEDTLRVYYVAVPRKLSAITDGLIIPDLWEDLILKYVLGTALQDDNDANNVQRGEMELDKYKVKLATLKAQSSQDFSAESSDKLVTNFRRV